jgi:hypothetical protein
MSLYQNKRQYIGEDAMDVDDRTNVREKKEVDVEDKITTDEPIIENDEGGSDVLEDKVTLKEEELRSDHQKLEEPRTTMAFPEDLNGPAI